MKAVGLSRSFSSTGSDEDDDTPSKRDRVRKIWGLLVQETRAVSLWSLLAVSLRLVLICLGMLVEFRGDSSESLGVFWKEPSSGLSVLSKELLTNVSVLGGWILGLVPSKVLLLQAPGFIFANPW